MKYYRLIDDNPKNWPSFTVGKIYPADYGSKDKTTVRAWANVISGQENWQEVTESEYLIQEAKERYPEGTRFICPGGEQFISSGIFNVHPDHQGIIVIANDPVGAVYDCGQWAEIIKESKEMELKITKERVLSAADKCPQAKATLKELFPDVFEESYVKKLAKHYDFEFIVRVNDLIEEAIPARLGNKIPGKSREHQAESIAKLIYETWIK